MPYVLLAVSLQPAHGYAIEELAAPAWAHEHRDEHPVPYAAPARKGWAGPIRVAAGAGWASAPRLLNDRPLRNVAGNWASALPTHRGMIDRFFGLCRRRGA
jgi:hypothetical protein